MNSRTPGPKRSSPLAIGVGCFLAGFFDLVFAFLLRTVLPGLAVHMFLIGIPIALAVRFADRDRA